MGQDPGRVGHGFQCMTVAWDPEGVEAIEKTVAGENKLAEDEGFRSVAEKTVQLLEYCNTDILGLADTTCWENFANGQYAMCITGSYARGTLLIANPDLKMGVFPLPNDTKETTNTLSGIDAAVCVSAQATDEEKEALTAQLTAAIDNIATESDIENLVKAKGFVDCVAFIDGDQVDVTVMTTSDGLTKEEVAQIRDVVLSKCQVTAQDITIVEVK